ncbi:hypothetical protein N2152v2_009852 [Parachlorella kessleri]
MANQYQKQFVPSVSGSKAESGFPGAENRGAGKADGGPEIPAGQFTITSEHEDTSDLPGTFTEKNELPGVTSHDVDRGFAGYRGSHGSGTTGEGMAGMADIGSKNDSDPALQRGEQTKNAPPS